MSERKCLRPTCCGSDGVDCCVPECAWSPWQAVVALIRRIARESA